MPAITVYGIRNCNTVKKALAWLDARGVDYRFHDLKRQGLPPELLDDWIARLGWEALINRRGQTWRRLDARQRENLDADGARRVMLENPSIIRRPLLLTEDGNLHLGFSDAVYERLLQQ
jgi:Spx/MgsR family transcriptional regulator